MKDGNEVERRIRWSRWNNLASNVVNRQVHGRHGRSGSNLSSLLNTQCILVWLYSVRLSVRTLGFQPKKRGSIPLPSTKILEVCAELVEGNGL